MRTVASIVLPFHNPSLPYLRLAIQSVIAQTFEDWELILLDDGSTDGTPEYAASLIDPRIRLVRDHKRLGLGARLNQGIDLARGEILVRMDSDDAMHPARLTRQIEVLKSAGPSVVTGTWSYSIDSRGAVVGQRRPENRRRSGFRARNSFLHPTVAAFTSWFREHRYTVKPVYHRCEDSELWCRTSSDNTFIQIPEHLLFYREGDWFSFDNHVATVAGLLSLAEIHAPDRNRFLLDFTREVAKLWIVGTAHAFRKASWITRSRYSAVTAAERAAAQQVLGELASVDTVVTHAVA